MSAHIPETVAERMCGGSRLTILEDGGRPVLTVREDDSGGHLLDYEAYEDCVDVTGWTVSRLYRYCRPIVEAEMGRGGTDYLRSLLGIRRRKAVAQ